MHMLIITIAKHKSRNITTLNIQNNNDLFSCYSRLIKIMRNWF